MARVTIKTGRDRLTAVRIKSKKEQRDALKKIGEEHKKERQLYVRHWTGAAVPLFKYRTRPTKSGWTLRVSMDVASAQSASVSVYELLDKGTKVRRALLTPDYVPGTSPGTLDVKPTIGRRLVARPDYEFPGIEARNQEELINKKVADYEEQLIDDILSRAFK